jgi:hypothetical protein
MTFRRTLLTLALGGGALAASGCAQPQPVYVQAPPQQVVATMPARVCDSSFRVINNSGLTVQTLQFSHSSLGGWGADQLGANVLPPGRAMNFRAANTGNWTPPRTLSLRPLRWPRWGIGGTLGPDTNRIGCLVAG